MHGAWPTGGAEPPLVYKDIIRDRITAAQRQEQRCTLTGIDLGFIMTVQKRKHCDKRLTSEVKD